MILACFDVFLVGTRRAFPKHIRPASRDVSNDARSGNANRYDRSQIFVGPDSLSKKSNNFLGIWTFIRQPLVQGNRQNTSKQTTKINHPTSLLRRGCKPATMEQLSDTIFSSQCMHNSTAKAVQTFFSRMMISVFIAHGRTGHLRWPGLRGRAASAATATWPCQASRLGTFYPCQITTDKHHDAVSHPTHATACRRSFAAPSGASPKGVRREDKKWWS